MKNPVLAWDEEYSRQGIPSSHRNSPSGVLNWALVNLPYISARNIGSAVDLGCGTGRNAIALADSGIDEVWAMDFSAAALEVAESRSGADRVNFTLGSVVDPLPFVENSFDLATDVFVYFHQLSDGERRFYRSEMHRILKPGGVLLVSLATAGDKYYGQCGTGPLGNVVASPRLTWDPIAEVGNILPTYEEFLAEFNDLFDFQMSWVKRKQGVMHGSEYMRETVATLWRAKKI
ncbi:class I SAM-dependent methyltransferase [Streptomyces sp. NBC_01465]|uniref:class I SAM-dependent methyltransferase n=1 Tax=Streptomyces sp. NBC_01465 TaxID=2903878 RepID=UPI002E309077|nr:class I SAM-dependent methyltransferase [Streptomyces sp. NBC_01465]